MSAHVEGLVSRQGLPSGLRRPGHPRRREAELGRGGAVCCVGRWLVIAGALLYLIGIAAAWDVVQMAAEGSTVVAGEVARGAAALFGAGLATIVGAGLLARKSMAYSFLVALIGLEAVIAASDAIASGVMGVLGLQATWMGLWPGGTAAFGVAGLLGALYVVLGQAGEFAEEG